MIRKTRLVHTRPDAAVAGGPVCHGSGRYSPPHAGVSRAVPKVLAQLKVFVGTKNDVLLLSSSGTGAMEASVSNLTSPGDRVLVLTAGKFGERWVGLAKAFGCVVDVVKAPYGETFDLAEVKKGLKPEHRGRVHAGHGDLDGCAARCGSDCEAAEGRRQRALLVVDGITGLGTTHFDVDAWGIDVLIGGSQKAVMIPPGLAYLSVSEKAWAAMESAEESALLLRPAQGAQERGQGRKRVHASSGAGRRPRRGYVGLSCPR